MISRLHWSRKVRKKSPQKKFGHFWKRFSGFWKIEFFSIFWNFSISRPSRVHWANFFTGKNTSKHVENKFEHFWERIWAFWKLKVFQFFEVFRLLDPPGCTGRNFSPAKIPRSMFQTCLIAIGNVFRAFWKIEIFSSFLKFYQVSTLQGALGNSFPENYLKTSLKFVWTLLGPFLDTFEISNFCRFFFRIFPSFDPPACTGQIFFPEKYLKTISTLVWKTFKNVLGHF